MLIDAHNRVIDYFRIAVTDRCNLRCVYCMPPDGIEPLPHEEILTYEEIIRVARIGLELGIRKIRLTGGEPLARKGLPFLVGELVKLPGLRDLSMTTNGALLAARAKQLRRAGLHRVNISLDSLDPNRYRALTRGGELEKVWEGIVAAQEAGMHPVKLNVVAMNGENGDEILSFARLTLKWPMEVRFIERMSLGETPPEAGGSYISSERVLEVIREAFPLERESSRSGNGPAQLFRIPGAVGAIGVIDPMSRHFCHLCNRLRLTPDGKLRACLFSDEEVDLKPLLRSRASDLAIRDEIQQATLRKPQGHFHQDGDSRVKKCMRPMSRIGG